MFCSIFMAIGFFTTDTTYETIDILKAVLSSNLSLVGTFCLTKALQTGKGGPIQALDSLKSLIPLFLNMFLVQILPTWLQVGGVALGMLGAGIISFSK
jgi:uncharacterized membrane protein